MSVAKLTLTPHGRPTSSVDVAAGRRISRSFRSLGAAAEDQIPSRARALTVKPAVLEKLATIQMVEVWIPTLDGRWLVLPRYTQPEKDVQAMLDHLHLALPSQPPPRIKASQETAPPMSAEPVAAHTPLW